MKGTEDMGIITDASDPVPAGPSLSPDEERARHDALRVEVKQVQEQRGCPMTELAKEAGIPYGTFSQWAAGNYAGRVRTYDDKVERWLRGLDGAKRAQGALPPPPPFVRTPSAESFITAFEHAQYAPDMVVVAGAAGVGKTSAIQAYRALAANVWLISGEPCITTPRMILDEIAELLGLAEGRSSHRVSRAIVARMRGTRGLLVIDEAQELNTATLNQLRALHDLAGVGVALVGNEKVQSRIEGGARKPEFAQLFSRIGMRVPRSGALKGDVDMLLDAWGIQGAGERRLLVAIAREPGALRSMTKTLRIASMQARAADVPLAVPHIKLAWEHLTSRPLDTAA